MLRALKGTRRVRQTELVQTHFAAPSLFTRGATPKPKETHFKDVCGLIKNAENKEMDTGKTCSNFGANPSIHTVECFN